MSPSKIIIKHLRDKQSIIPRSLPQIAELVSEWLSVTPDFYLYEPRKEIQLTEKNISDHLAWLDYKAERGVFKTFLLCNIHRKYPIHLDVIYDKFVELEKIWIIVDSQFPQKSLEGKEIVRFIGQVGSIFEAYTGYFYCSSLAKFNQRFNLPTHTFDSCQVPYGIWWVNYWSEKQVEIVGRKRVNSASWYALKELSNGAIVGLTTETMLNLENSEHLDKLNGLSEYFNLRELQEAHRLPKPTMDTPI